MSGQVASIYSFTFGAASPDQSLYLAGVVNELEDQDVHHTIIWERLGGTWKRYTWKNRSYGLAAYESADTGTTVVLMGFEGTLKVRSVRGGSSDQVVDADADGPSSLRSIGAIRVIGDHLYLTGMRRMVYRRPLSAVAWSRFDEGLRLAQTDPSIAGLSSIDGHDPVNLYAVGLGGEIWHYTRDRWNEVDSPTDVRLTAVRCLRDGRVIVGGADGTLLIGSGGQWTAIAQSFPNETFSCIETWRDQCFVSTDAGKLFELHVDGDPVLSPISMQGMQYVTWVTATEERVYFIGRSSVTSLGGDGWRDESPPDALLA